MKKILIIIGVVVIVVLAGAWVYLLVANPNDSTARFALFGFGDTTDLTIEETPTDFIPNSNEMKPDTNRGPLRQLTKRPVVGYGGVQLAASSSPQIYFMEAGTGHVYSIETTTYGESRLSNITIPNVTKAVFTSDGKYAVAISDKITVITFPSLPEEKPSSFSVNEKAENTKLIDDTLLYLVSSNADSMVKQLTLSSPQSGVALFTIPFREAAISWGSSLAGPHYFYPKPAADLEGYLYSYFNGLTERKPLSGFNFSVYGTSDFVLYSHNSTAYKTEKYDTRSGTIRKKSVKIVPEKCTQISPDSLVCGFNQELNVDSIESWRTGETQFSDSLMYVNLSSGVNETLPGTKESKDKNIDVVDLTYEESLGSLLLRDKKTSNLWLYRLPESI